MKKKLKCSHLDVMYYRVDEVKNKDFNKIYSNGLG